MTESRPQVLAIIATNRNDKNPLESLDAIFASAVFDIAVSVLFLGESIASHLIESADADTGKQPPKQWAASDLYDIEALWVLAADLKALNVNAGALPSNVVVLQQLPNMADFKHGLSL